MSRDSVKTECIAAQQNVVPEKGVRYLLSDRCGNKQTWKSCLISFVLLFIFNGIAPLSMFIYLGSLFSWVLLSDSSPVPLRRSFDSHDDRLLLLPCEDLRRGEDQSSHLEHSLRLLFLVRESFKNHP